MHMLQCESADYASELWHFYHLPNVAKVCFCMFLLCSGQTSWKTLHHRVLMVHSKSFSITDNLIAKVMS